MQVDRKIFLDREAQVRNSSCFRRQSERRREWGAGAYYRNRKREAKDFEKFYE